MTQPRCVLPGATLLVTRRTLRRTHLFRPDPELSQLYLYLLAVLAERHGILIHGVVLMSTHEHLVLTDTRGRLPLFLRELHRLFALGVKALRKWEGAVWDHERPSVVHLRTHDAIVEKLAYVIANPVAAGLVKYAKDWPGVTTRPSELGQATFSARRPGFFFDAHNPLWPDEASLDLALPPLPVGVEPAALREAVATELAEIERQARASVQCNGRGFVGRDRVCKASPYSRAKSWEPVRGRNPQFAVGKHQRQAFFDAVAWLRDFRRTYHDAMSCWRRGMRAVCFPSGTWIMRVVHAATVDLGASHA